MAFKVKVDGRWKSYTNDVDSVLKQAFVAGFPSVRLTVKSVPYKFDFKRMQQKELLTGEISELCKPLHIKDPKRPFFPQLGERPVFAVRVPNGAQGKKMPVPHPKELGKQIKVLVPEDAKPGSIMFVPVPQRWRGELKYGLGGAVAGGVVVAGVIVGEEVAAALAGGGLMAASGAAAPVIVGGMAVAGAVAAGAAAVHVAKKHPFKATAAGLLAFAGLAAADHVSDVGVVDAAAGAAEAAGDVVEGAGDAAEAVGGAAGDVADVAADAADWTADAADWLGDSSEDVVDFIDSLF